VKLKHRTQSKRGCLFAVAAMVTGRCPEELYRESIPIIGFDITDLHECWAAACLPEEEQHENGRNLYRHLFPEHLFPSVHTDPNAVPYYALDGPITGQLDIGSKDFQGTGIMSLQGHDGAGAHIVAYQHGMVFDSGAECEMPCMIWTMLNWHAIRQVTFYPMRERGIHYD